MHVGALQQHDFVALQRILFLESWRWCFFFAGFVPVYYFSEGAVQLAEMVVESKLFTVQQALYFAVSIHVRPAAADAALSAAAVYHAISVSSYSKAGHPAYAAAWVPQSLASAGRLKTAKNCEECPEETERH